MLGRIRFVEGSAAEMIDDLEVEIVSLYGEAFGGAERLSRNL